MGAPNGEFPCYPAGLMFGHRKVAEEPRLSHLESEVNKVQSELRQLQLEQENMHDQVRRWMRRAVAAERRLSESGTAVAASSPAQPAATPARMTPARLRALAQGRVWGGGSQNGAATASAAPGSTNGHLDEPE